MNKIIGILKKNSLIEIKTIKYFKIISISEKK